MKRRNIFPCLLGIMLLAAAGTTLTACSSNDNDDNGGNDTKQPTDETIKYDDLAVFQQALCTIDSAGQLVRYEVGEAIQESEPQHRYIGVDNIEEAARIFANWIAPDVKLAEITPTVTDLTAELTDTLGHAQGTVYFRAGSGTTVAEVTFSAGTNLKYVDRITFLLNSAWPYNSESLRWHKGDIRRFAITGKPAEYLHDKDRELNFVLVREGKNGEMPMWVALSNDSYSWGPTIFNRDQFEKVSESNYCPASAKARAISSCMQADWSFFKSRFEAAGSGELRDGGSYWIDGDYISWFTEYKEVIMLSNAWIHGISGNGGSEQFLLKIDWYKDGELPLRGTAGLDISSGFEDVRGSYTNLFDGLNETMWETNHLTWASQSDPKYYVEFESTELIKPTGYTFVTGNTQQWPKENCNPHNWKLYGKRKTRDDWTLLDERSGENLPFESYKPVDYNFSNGGGEYQYFRLEITDDQPWLKLAEFKFKY